jgi:hypothetical protein
MHIRGERKEVGRQAVQSHVMSERIQHPGSHVGKWATNRASGDTGVSKVENLIETGYEEGPEEPTNPSTQGFSWHLLLSVLETAAHTSGYGNSSSHSVR